MGLFGRKKDKGAIPAEYQAMVDGALAAAGVDPATMAAGSSMGLGDMLEARKQGERYTRLHERGVEVPGTVLEVKAAGHEHELRLRVEADPPYDVTIRQALHASFDLQPGSRVTLRMDPSDRDNVAVWGGDPDAVAAADPLDALAALADRREQGLIGEAEYEAERARLLAEM